MYQLTHSRHVARLEDQKMIQLDAPSAELDEYLAWVASGNTPLQPVPNAPVVPKSVTRFQARAALYQAGLLTAVEGKMGEPATAKIAQIAWEDADIFLRDSPTVAGMAAALGLDEATVDGLFIAAAKITA